MTNLQFPKDYYHSVAVIKKNDARMYDVETLADLKGKKACFAKVKLAHRI